MSSLVHRIVFFLSVVTFVFGVRSASAQTRAPSASSSEGPSDDDLPWQAGPRTIELGHDLTLALPERHAFLAMPHAAELMKKIGNFHNGNLLGIVVPKDGSDWFVSIRYDEAGYIKDDEKIDARELLEAIKEGTEEANQERVQKGFKPLQIGGWSQNPAYDRAKHHLVWGIRVSSEGSASINHNTRVLGRRGYVSLNLVTDVDKALEYRSEVTALLAATSFKVGARYEDFDSKVDKVAEYGLTGLILGGAGLGAAKLVKLGFFAKFWNVIVAALLAMKKAIVFVFVAIGAFFKKLFAGREKRTES